MGAATQIAAKDLRLRMRDRSALILGILAPLALAFIFNLIFGGAGDGSGLDLDYGLVDNDGSEISAAFADLLAQIQEEGVLTITTLADEEAGDVAIERDELDAYFLLPNGFERSVLVGRGEIGVVGNVDAPTSTQIAASISEQFATGIGAAGLALATTAAARDGAGGAPVSRDPSESAFSFEFADVSADTRQLDASTYLAAGMAVFFLFFTVSFGVAGLLEEERQGTLARLFAAPIRRHSVVTGKAILSFVLGIISMTVLVIASRLLLGAVWGHPLGVALLVVTGVGAAIGVMGLVASIARSPEGAENLGSIIAVILGMLGGTFFPIGQGSDFLSAATYIAPHAWFLRGLGDLAGDAPWTAALPAAGALGLFALVTGSLAWVMMRRRLAR